MTLLVVLGFVLVFGGLLATYAAVALKVGGFSSVTEMKWLQDVAGRLGLITLLGLPVITGEFMVGVMVGRRRRVEGKG